MTVIHHLVSVGTLARVIVLVFGKTCNAGRIGFVPSCGKLASLTKCIENKGMGKCLEVWGRYPSTQHFEHRSRSQTIQVLVQT